MGKNLDFILRSIVIYIVLGFSFSAASKVAVKYVYWGNVIVFIGFICVLDRLIRYDKQKDIKLFERINIVWLHLLIMGITIFCIDLFHLI